MRRYRIYKNKWTYFVFVCNRDGLTYEVDPGGDNGKNFITVLMDIPRGRFQELLEDIDCEIQRDGCKAKAPVISARTFFNPKKFNRLLDWYGFRSFRLLKRDENKIL